MPQTLRRSDLVDQIAKLRELRDEYRPEEPIEIGALLPPVKLGSAAFDIPKGVITGAAEQIADSIRDLARYGVSHVQVRFLSRSATELCDQIEEFGTDVGRLLR